MFCTVKGLEDLGTAKLLEVSNRESAVEFFDSPAIDGRITQTIPSSRVVRRTLGANTRVYYLDPRAHRWFVGRVLEDMNDDSFIRFANKSDRSVPHAHLFVRWKRPITDPSIFLANGVTETPQYAYARSDFLRSYIQQRAVAGGISALTSSAIELEPHQIAVVRRVLNDTSQRHLLADEVGLGKTIEAGIIIRQAVLDDPKAHRIVVIVPSGLTQQWRTELAGRFGVGDFIDDSIMICALDRSTELEAALSGATMVVVDEAHHLTSLSDTSSIRAYAIVSRCVRSVDRLLLLSATPALRNEAGFLRMLHLLDPAVYKLEDEAAFKQRIVHRQSLAEAVAFLDPQNVLSLDPVLDDVAAKLPTDRHLQALITALKAQLLGFPDPQDPQLQTSLLELRAHLSETYRLHRRILRNRRKSLRFITPERRGSDCWCVPGWQAAHIESLLENWRQHAVSQSAESDEEAAKEMARFYVDMVTAFLDNPRHLGSLCDNRLRQISGHPVTTPFPQEIGILQDIADTVADTSWLKARFDQVAKAIRTLTARSKKVVVFCSDESTADELFAYLIDSRLSTAVRHRADPSDASRRGFQSDTNVNVIVCGPSAEEGLNLQGAERTVVHVDLPFAPGRIEQRIGRVDRYGSGSTIRSLVFVDDGSQLQSGWYKLLDKGLNIFDRSIASLQYLLEDELQRLKHELFASGTESFDKLLTDFAGPNGKVAKELHLLDAQDALDELSPLNNSNSEELQEVDSEWKAISSAVTRWVVDTLLFEKAFERDVHGNRSPDPPYRFRYRKPGLGGPATLIPVSGLLYDFIGALDLEAPGGSSSQPLSHRYSAHRKTAVTRGTRVLRYGDVFVDAVKAFSDTDDRGRSFGMWRQHSDGPESAFSLYFRFDFLVETRLDDAESCLEQAGILKSAAARAAIRRRGDSLFAPTTARIWVTDDGDAADRHIVARCLEIPYSKEAGGVDYVDTNLDSSRLHSLREHLPETFVSWGERCARLRERALAFVLDDADLRDRQARAIAAATRESELRHAQLGARIRTLQGVEAEEEQVNLELERALDEALRAGISAVSIRLDVVGFVILSRNPYSVANGGEELT